MIISNILYKYRNATVINTSLQIYDATKNEVDKFRVESIQAIDGVRYKGNFYGLLSFLRVDPSLFLVTLVMNGFSTPYQYDGTLLEIKVANKLNVQK